TMTNADRSNAFGNGNVVTANGFARANDIGYEPNIFNLIDPIGWDRSTNPANRSPGQIVATSVSEAYVDVTEPTVVGPQRQAWRAQHVRWLMDDFYNSTMKDERVELHNSLRKLRYDGIRSEPSYGMTYRPTVKKLCRMNPFGRVGKADATTELAVFAGVRSGRSWYLLGSDGLLKYDLNSKTHTSLAVPAPLPEMWSCSGITRDTKRNRILVICAEMPIKIADSPRLHLYCFDEATQAWSVLSTHDSFMNGLAYSASDDKLYSLLLNNSGPKLAGHTSTLVEMDAEGGSKRYVTTSDNLNRYLRHGSSHVQMALCENDIVVHGADPPSEDPFMTTVIFDRKTGKVRYAND
ncbi:MAG: hypothetical protein K2Z81_13165, partial [Cyanobacteria bacterium]|nr:hypothetical protein [Cyanobacteriota bacterium]